VIAHADEGLDLRDKITEYSKSANLKRWQIEDKLTSRERSFQDGIMQEYRETVTKGLDQIEKAPNWKQALRTYRDQMRSEISELRQKVRVHREEFQLTFLATSNEMDKDLKDFLAPLEESFRKNKSDAYQKAENDFQSSRDDLREDLRNWKDRIKDLRTQDSFVPSN
jgi:hypothetical protein